MNRRFVLALLLASSLPTLATLPHLAVAGEVAVPTADQLLSYVDKNMTFATRTATIKMTVVSPQRTRTFVMQTYGRGETESAIEYLDPARDKGTKMLRRGDEMWMWMPSVESIQKISGHMLRQGMMGSDLSYEDMMGAAQLRDKYTAKVTGAETKNGILCWRVEMIAKDATVAYPKRISWIDQKSHIPISQELYAVSGMLLKVWDMSDIRTYDGGRQFPAKMVIVDKLKQGTSTTIEMTSITFGVALEEETFSQRWLERH